MFDFLVPDTVALDAIVLHTIAWGTAFVSLALTTVLAFALRGQFSFATLCVTGIGVAPLIIYLVIFTAFYVYGVSQIAERPIWASSTFQIATIPFWHSFTMMMIIAPNYFLCFVITCVFLIISAAFKATEEVNPAVVVILLPVHGLGLYFFYWFLTNPGSL